MSINTKPQFACQQTCSFCSISFLSDWARDSRVSPLLVGGVTLLRELLRVEEVRGEETRGLTAERAVAPLEMAGVEAVPETGRLGASGGTRAVVAMVVMRSCRRKYDEKEK